MIKADKEAKGLFIYMNRQIKIHSATRWSYFQWFLLGFYWLQDEGKIKVEIDVPLLQHIGLWNHNGFLSRCSNRIFQNFYDDQPLLLGQAIFDDEAVEFAIDSSDAPFIYDRQVLDTVDIYFKMQCPKEFLKEGFHLTNDVIIPWTDYAFAHGNPDEYVDKKPKGKRKDFTDFERYIHKIYPLMIGPRRLAFGNDFYQLRRGYENIIQSRCLMKEKNVMCYFGNAKGPGRSENITFDTVDYDWEKDIMGLYPELNHPNEKRAVVRDIIKELPNSDARIINDGNSDTGTDNHPELVVSLKDFGAYVAQFKYNFNVSGYRMSIPNRFIDSFSVGTSIITDDLQIKWYKPFEPEEVIEIGSMGYEPMKTVNWEQVRTRMNVLPEQYPEVVAALFNQKWRPDVVAQYMIDAMMNVK